MSGSGSLVSSLQYVKGWQFTWALTTESVVLIFFFSQHRFCKPLFQGCLHWPHQSLIKSPQWGAWGQINFQQIPLPWTPSCVISLEMTSQHWRSPLSALLNDLKLSDQITSILPLLDIFLVKANRKLSVVMLRVSSRCTPRVTHYVNRLLSFLEFILDVQRCQKINTDMFELWGWCHSLLWERNYPLY